MRDLSYKFITTESLGTWASCFELASLKLLVSFLILMRALLRYHEVKYEAYEAAKAGNRRYCWVWYSIICCSTLFKNNNFEKPPTRLCESQKHFLPFSVSRLSTNAAVSDGNRGWNWQIVAGKQRQAPSHQQHGSVHQEFIAKAFEFSVLSDARKSH